MLYKNMALLACSLMILLSCGVVQAQKRSNNAASEGITESPKLVVGIIVDQMRYDYLTRFWDHFGEDGFKRLVGQGFSGRNHHFNYAPTSTGPGHASVYSGATPSIHGIIGNSWFDKASGEEVYCVSDPAYASVGTHSEAGEMSPHRLRVSTITDELRLHTQMRGKVVAIALKDRGSVLPAGHTANAAFWFQGGLEGKWVSSSYYMDVLPDWVNAYNASRAIDKYREPWNTYMPLQAYLESGPDNNAYEGLFEGKGTPTFPYDLNSLWEANGQYDLLRVTPFGNSLTTDFALLAMEKEGLGTDDITDFLAISYSSTDYIGHKFGVDSKEVQDTYIRLDLELGRLLKALDKAVGEGAYTLFLTADHGAMQAEGILKEHRIPSGHEESLENKAEFKEFVQFTYGTADIIRDISNHQVFLDHRLLESLDLNPREVQEKLAAELLRYEGIDRVYTAHQMQQESYHNGIPYLLQNGYHQKLSGDVLWVPSPGYTDYGKTGSTHGSAQIYDTHVPLLFYGNGIRPGSSVRRTEIPDIAPTLSVLLGISFPNGTTGQPVAEALK